MNQAVTKEILRLGGDPADDIWFWLVERGPHGPSFSWGQTRAQPPGYVGIDHLREIAGNMATSIPGFEQRTRPVIRLAMQSSMPDLVRRAVQVAAVVGGEDELREVKQLVESANQEVASDARACVFHLKRRV